MKYLMAESVGSTMVNLNQRILLDLDLIVPPSPEQARIVEKLDELLSDLEAGVAELKAAQRKLTQYRQSLLKAAVEGALTADWRARRRSPSPQPLPHQGGGAETAGAETAGAEGARDAASAARDAAMPSTSARLRVSDAADTQPAIFAHMQSSLAHTASGSRAPLSPRGRGAGGEGASHDIAGHHPTHSSTAGDTIPAAARMRTHHALIASDSSAPLSPRGRGVGGEGANHISPPPPALLRQRARDMRHEPTPQEHQLWQNLRAKRFAGYKFRRQQPIGRYIVDFVCFAERLIVELDGGQHADAAAYDAERDGWLQSQGFRVLRFWNNEWAQHTAAVLDAIWAALQASPAVSDADAAAPSPLPNPHPDPGAARLGVHGHADLRSANVTAQPTRGEGLESESGAELLQRILRERRARWEQKQLAKFAEQGKTPPKGWQEKYPEPVAPDLTDLPPLPEGWVWTTLGQCFNVQVGATPSRKEQNYWSGTIPWVSSGEVRFNRITNTKEFISQHGLRNSSAKINPIGSVLLGMIGEGKTRGQCAILNIEAANNQNCAAIWVGETQVPPEFVFFWLWSQYDQTRRGSSGNNQPALNKFLVERMPMPLGTLEEMKVCVSLVAKKLEKISELQFVIEHSIRQAAAQRKNILKAAFSGQLVPQDPNDEPASELLARIRAQREANPGAPARKRGRKAKGAA